jgi:hypothetical protein
MNSGVGAASLSINAARVTSSDNIFPTITSGASADSWGLLQTSSASLTKLLWQPQMFTTIPHCSFIEYNKWMLPAE